MVSTRLFDRIGAVYLRATRGSGQRFLLLLVALVAPLCALLPNATTVILLAPIIVRVAQALEVDFVGPLMLMAIVSNSAGLLTLVGDPATFLVGSSIGMSFGEYLRRVSLGGLMLGARAGPADARAHARRCGACAGPCHRRNRCRRSRSHGSPCWPLRTSD